MNIRRNSLLISAALFALLSSGAMAQNQGAMGAGGVRGYSSVGDRAQRNTQLYDRSGRPVRKVNGNVVLPADGTYYNANRQPLGNSPQPVYDLNGNVAGYQPGGQQPIYDARGNIVGYSQVGNQPIYDANGNIVGYTQSNNGGQVPIYDANGNVVGYTSTQYPTSTVATPRYDRNGNLVNSRRVTYDANGNPILVPDDQDKVLNVGPFKIRY